MHGLEAGGRLAARRVAEAADGRRVAVEGAAVAGRERVGVGREGAGRHLGGGGGARGRLVPAGALLGGGQRLRREQRLCWSGEGGNEYSA